VRRGWSAESMSAPRERTNPSSKTSPRRRRFVVVGNGENVIPSLRRREKRVILLLSTTVTGDRAGHLSLTEVVVVVADRGHSTG
jgi:hypothetical protein